MSNHVATRVIEAQHDEDPKKVINKALKGWIERIHPTGGDAILCVYERPEKIKGTSLLLPETAQRRTEDKFQGVVGLLVKVGPNFAKHHKVLGLDPPLKVGDWVAFRNQDTNSFILGDRSMRRMEGQFILMRLDDPDCIV